MKIILEPHQNLYFISDTHYAHKNICSSTTEWVISDNSTIRKFDSLNLMNDTIVSNINEIVGENDILIHVGDWSFGGFDKIEEFRNKIVCKNIHLVLGNHDHHIKRNKENIQNLFSSVSDIMELSLHKINSDKSVSKFRFFICHYPIASWKDMQNEVIHIHGHTHLPAKYKVGNGRSIDVGIDGNNLKPTHYMEVIRLLKNNPIKSLQLPKDHHSD